jgi:acetolactate synthase-1/2/3 large subunit
MGDGREMTGAEMVVECLIREGVDTVFGYPGGAVLSIYDALAQSPIRHILVRHEQAAAHAADGYSRASGRVGVCLATSGPGSTNLVTGIASAYMDSIPLVAITGQVAVSGLGSDGFQEADTTGITMPVTKHNYLVKSVEDIPRIMREAFHVAGTGRPGPVLVDIPKDVAAGSAEFRFPKSVHLPGYKPNYQGHPAQIKRAAQALNLAERPVILAGGGVIRSGASAELLALAEQADAPVAVTLMGVSAIPATHRLYLGLAGMHGTYAANKAIMEADLLLAVGTRFAERSTGSTAGYAPGAYIIHIDVDPAEIGKNVRVDTPIVGHARVVLEALFPLVTQARHAGWARRVSRWRRRKASAVAENSQGLDPLEVLREVYRAAGPDAIVTTDVGQHQMWAAHSWRSGQPGSFISSGGLGAMGYGFPAAIGVKAACPGKRVIAISGDGSFQMNLQEMATATSHGLPVKIIVLNNSCLGMVRQLQEFYCERRYFAIDLATPDFPKLAEAYGATGYRAKTPEEVRPVLQKTMAHDGLVVAEFRICPEANVFPMVSPGNTLDRMIGV